MVFLLCLLIAVEGVTNILNDVNPGGCHLYASCPEKKHCACFSAVRGTTEAQPGGTEATFLLHPSPYDDNVKYQGCIEYIFM